MRRKIRQTSTQHSDSQAPGFEPLVGVDKMADLLGVPKRTLYRWCQDQRYPGFPYYKPGRELRFRLSEIEAWLKQYKAGRG